MTDRLVLEKENATALIKYINAKINVGFMRKTAITGTTGVTFYMHSDFHTFSMYSDLNSYMRKFQVYFKKTPKDTVPVEEIFLDIFSKDSSVGIEIQSNDMYNLNKFIDNVDTVTLDPEQGIEIKFISDKILLFPVVDVSSLENDYAFMMKNTFDSDHIIGRTFSDELTDTFKDTKNRTTQYRLTTKAGSTDLELVDNHANFQADDYEFYFIMIPSMILGLEKRNLKAGPVYSATKLEYAPSKKMAKTGALTLTTDSSKALVSQTFIIVS